MYTYTELYVSVRLTLPREGEVESVVVVNQWPPKNILTTVQLAKTKDAAPTGLKQCRRMWLWWLV